MCEEDWSGGAEEMLALEELSSSLDPIVECWMDDLVYVSKSVCSDEEDSPSLTLSKSCLSIRNNVMRL